MRCLSLVAPCAAGLAVLAAGCTDPPPAPLSEGPYVVPDSSLQTERWATYIGIPVEAEGPPRFYAYWLDSRGAFAFRPHEGLPIPGPPERTGEETEVPALVILELARTIRTRGIYDIALEDDIETSGYSLQNDRIRLFASRSFSVRSVVEILFLAGFIVLGGILFLTIQRRLRREQAARQEAIEARGRMIRVREAERTVLAREIHDGPIQNLHALRLQAHAALLAEGIPPDNDLEDGLQRVSQELRSIMEGLRPPALDRFGFTAALESHAARVGLESESVEIDVSAEAERCLSDAEEDFQLGVFRVVQEAVSNAIQHGSQHAKVTVTLKDGQIEACISDDGSGFGHHPVLSSDALIDSGHYGLVGMRERAEVLDGDLTFGNSALGGAEVRLRVPVPTATLAL